MTTIFTKPDLKRIRDLIGEEGIEALSHEFSLSIGSVRNILFGQHENIKVCRKALDMANQEMDKINNQKQAIA